MTPLTHEFIETHRLEIIRLLSELVRIPTENRPPVGNEKPGQDWLASECRESGFTVDLYELDDVPGFTESPYCWKRNFRDRPNLIARWKGTGGGKSLLFSGHMDIVPPYPLPWNLHEPYETALQANRLYGRGSADMKAGLIAALFAMRLMKESGFQPKGDILLESVVDEEYAGANGTLAGRIRGDNADFAIVPEPTAMTICPACFGAKLARITVTGESGMPYHGHKIANPVYSISRIILALEKFESFWNKHSGTHPLFDEPLNVIVYKLLAGEPSPDGQMTVPPDCWLSVIVQTLPMVMQDEFDAVLNEFLARELSGDPELQRNPPMIESEFRYMEPAEIPTDHPGVQSLVGVARELGVELTVRGAPFSCDLFLFHRFGVPAVLLGPRSGNCHGKDEWVNVDDILNLVRVYAEMIRRWCG